MVKEYFTVYDDAHWEKKEDNIQCRKRKADTLVDDMGFECPVCQMSFDSFRQRSNHMWSKHRVKNPIRRMIGDESQCQICGMEFGCRARLVKHLLERRVRSTTRNKSCQEQFFALGRPLVSEDLYSRLEEQDAAMMKKARAAGHTNMVADVPAEPTRPSILKKTRRCGNDLAPPCTVKKARLEQ